MLFGVNQRPRSLVRDLCKTGAAERSVLPKGENGSQGQRLPVPCGTEGKPDFPLQVRPNSFFVCFPVTRFSKKEFAFGRNAQFGVNHGSRAVIGDLCETQTAECGVSRKRVIGVGLLFWLIARGENRLFSPEEVQPICFCGTKKRSYPQSGQLTNTSLSSAAKVASKAKRNRVWPPAMRRSK